MKMTFSVRARHFFSFLMLASVVVLTVGLCLEDVLGSWFNAQIAAELRRHAFTGRALIEMQEKLSAESNLDPLADLFGQDLALRVTFIGADGRVLGDSQRSGDALLAMENHGKRPEVLAALLGGFGQSERYSTTLSRSMLYVAVPFHHSKGFVGVVRVAMSVENVKIIKAHLRKALIIAGFLAVLVAISLSDFSSQWATRSLRYVIALAQSMASSTSFYRIDVHPNDEMAGLVGSINLLAEEKNNTLVQLSEQKSKMAAVLQSMGEGVIALDGQQCITLMNRSVLELLHLPSPLIGRPLGEVLPSKAFNELGLNTHRLETFSTEFDLDGPSLCQVTAVMTPLHDHQGYVIVLRDVTEIRRLEQVRRDFIANVSHELRTPVSVIQANAQTLLAGALKDKKYSRVLADAMERNANRLGRIISDLLDLSRLEADHFSLELTTVELLLIVQEAVELMRASATEKQNTLDISVPPSFSVQADEEALRRILINFLDNAIKYTPPKTNIIVRVRDIGHQLRLEVLDDGPGVASMHKDRIFERFYRVDSGRTRKMGGTGLGLSIVKHLAEKMGQSVGMEAVEPHGSLFWVTLSYTKTLTPAVPSISAG